MNKELQALLLKQQEEQDYHLSMDTEFSFYRDVASGNLDILKGDIEKEPHSGLGILSNNPITNQKYHLIILIAMITRFCIEAGLAPETSYTMSDLYIRKLDNCPDKASIARLKRDALTDFTTTMHNLQKQPQLSYHVHHGMNYIEKHLTMPLNAQDVAHHLGLNPEYLSRLFRQDTGYSLQQFILHKKCSAACYMLLNSSASCTEISTFLGFSSCSHFIRQFKKENHITPNQFRRQKSLLSESKYNANHSD